MLGSWGISLTGTSKSLGGPSDSARSRAAHTVCAQPKSLCSLSEQHSSIPDRAARHLQAADSRRNLWAFPDSQRFDLPNAGRQASAKQGLSGRQSWPCQSSVSTSVPSEGHSAEHLSKGSVHTALADPGDKLLPEHPSPRAECCFLYPSLLQRCYQLQPLKNSWHLFEPSSLQSPQKLMGKNNPFLSLDFGSGSERPDGLESRRLLFLFSPVPFLLLHLMFVARDHFFFQSIQPVTGGCGCLTPSPPFLEAMLIEKLHSRAETTRN